jgi:hypothetical protein
MDQFLLTKIGTNNFYLQKWIFVLHSFTLTHAKLYTNYIYVYDLDAQSAMSLKCRQDKKSCCISFLIPTQLLNLNVSIVAAQTHLGSRIVHISDV